MHPDPQRLLEQAEAFYSNANDETDLRMAVRSAYYAVFHFSLRSAADLLAGGAHRGTARYNLVYCSVQHKRLKTLCGQLRGSVPERIILPYSPPPPSYFGRIAVFARLVPGLQEERHRADYHPIVRFDKARTLQAISTALDAIEHFEAASIEQRQAFLMLLLFEPRQP